MAWMIPIIADKRNRSVHKIGVLISLILLFLGLGVVFFISFGFNKFDGLAIHSIWIIGGIVFLISIFVIVGIIASVSSGKVKINNYKHNLNESEKLNPKMNPYIIRRPSQNQLEVTLHEKSEKSIPNPQEVQFCRYCGAKLEKNAKFCQDCGIKVKK